MDRPKGRVAAGATSPSTPAPATIIEPRPQVNGSHFRPKKTQFTFDPPLFAGVDYEMTVKNAETAQLSLKTGRKWRSDGLPGPLKLKRIDTGAGPLRIDAKFGGVTVAEVQANLGGHGVTVETTSDKKRARRADSSFDEVAATPRAPRGDSAEARNAATRIVCEFESRRRRDADARSGRRGRDSVETGARARAGTTSPRRRSRSSATASTRPRPRTRCAGATSSRAAARTTPSPRRRRTR